MKIKSLKVENFPPIRHFEISNLGSVVIIAGANGSGKTRLKEAIIETFRSTKSPQISIEIESTRPEEKELIQATRGNEHQELQQYMNSRTKGGTYIGSVIQIDSNRTVQPIKFHPLSLSTPDPDDVEIQYTYYLSSFISRWQELVNKIYQKVANRDYKIATYIKANPNSTAQEALKEYPDPFLSYQEIFTKLLPGKTLEPIDPKLPKEFYYKIGNSTPFLFNTLSSGEQEVVKIAFDLISKKIRHCVVLFDEPELHLHPTLTFRLIETLKYLGDNTNQFFLFTHSADLISTYYTTGNVFFIDSIANTQGNQAHRLSCLKK